MKLTPQSPSGAAPLLPFGRQQRDPPNTDPELDPPPSHTLPTEPLERTLWNLRPPPTLLPPPPPPPGTHLPPIQLLVDRLLRRIALEGSRHRGTVLLEIGAGAFQGSSVTIHAEGRCLVVEIEAADGEALRRWQCQLQERLKARGLEVEVNLR
ncbi:MAG: hypothetical protein RMJ98_13875 [Myxococcales bacterium]|nr:hypothetical protein [Polyangiaceae bacterium]MDW8250380.1 hypothetical protein [Myxococcales bacterium]